MAMSRVALREITPATDLGWGDVVQQPPIKFIRIPGILDIGDWLHRYGYMCFLGWGRRLPVKPYFFCHFTDYIA